MTTIDLYKQHKAGKVSKEKFLYEVRRDQNLPFITNLTSYDDAIKILKNKSIIKETLTADDEITAAIDRLNPRAVRKGIEFELNKMSEINDENYEKARTKAVKKLIKDPNAYDDILFANSKQVKKSDAVLQMEPVKKENKVDKPNEMKKMKGAEKPKANTKTSKKENKKGNPKGVKQMTYDAKKAKGIKKVMEKTGKEKILEAITSVLKEDESFSNKTLFNKIYLIAKKSPTFSFVSDIEVPTQAGIGKEFTIKSKLKGTNPNHENEFDEFTITQDESGDVIGYYEPNGYDKEIENIKDFIDFTRAAITPKENTIKIVDEEGNIVDNNYLLDLIKTATDKRDFINKVNYGITNNQSTVSKNNDINIGLFYDKNKKTINEDMHSVYGMGQTVPTPDGEGIVKEIVGGTLTVELQNGTTKDYQVNVINHAVEQAKQPKKEEVMVPDVDKKPEAKYDNKQTLIQKLKQIVAKMKLKKEAFALKDKAGNVQYAKDNAEASDIKNQARLKGVMLKQTTV